MTTLRIEAHVNCMVQVVGQISFDLFNSKKRCWEQMVQPCNSNDSLSSSQIGIRDFILKYEERLSLNIAPTTISIDNTVRTVLSIAAWKKKSAKQEGLLRLTKSTEIKT